MIDRNVNSEISSLLSSFNGGIIEKADVLEELENMLNKQEILRRHTNKIWQASDGRWKTHLPSSDRKLIARSTLEKLQLEIIKFYKEGEKKDIEKKTIKEVYPVWLEYKNLRSKSTSYATRLDVDWRKYYINNEIIHIPINNLTKIKLENWAYKLIDEYKLTKKQYYNITTILRGIIDYAYDNVEENNIFRKVKIAKGRFHKPPQKESSSQIYFFEEKADMIRLAEEDYEKSELTVCLAICLNFYLGLRVGELMALKESDREGNYLYVQRQEVLDNIYDGGRWKKTGFTIDDYLKADKEVRPLFLVKEARRYWDMIVLKNSENSCSGDYLFMDEGMRVHVSALHYRLKKYCKALGIRQKSSHKIRKTVLSALADAVGFDEAMKWGGQSDVNTLFNSYYYSRQRDEEKERAIDKALENVTECNHNFIKEKNSETMINTEFQS